MVISRILKIRSIDQRSGREERLRGARERKGAPARGAPAMKEVERSMPAASRRGIVCKFNLAFRFVFLRRHSVNLLVLINCY